jgi:putative spermidine/putrescine transport system ATP-binding protein
VSTGAASASAASASAASASAASASAASPSAVTLRSLRKEFGPPGKRVVAVEGIDLEVADGEFVSLLGPSGSGKTTVLRLIAGFEAATSGAVLLGGRDVTALPPFARDVNTVFQDYALFPHLSVLGNVEYGLRVRKVAAAQRRRQALEMLSAVQLEGFEQRTPAQLSGGQRQRVALARALVNKPRVLLLDEPLGALDLKLREQMQRELTAIQRSVGITFIFVTHDQEEALTMSDRVVVFDRGRIEQVGTPAEVYERPATPFVAGFVGTSNLLEPPVAAAIVGRAQTLSIRPEKIRVQDDGNTVPEGCHGAGGTVREVVYAGPGTRFLVDLDVGGHLLALQQNLETSSMDVLGYRGRRVLLTWRSEHEFAIRSSPDSPALDSPN